MAMKRAPKFGMLPGHKFVRELAEYEPSFQPEPSRPPPPPKLTMTQAELIDAVRGVLGLDELPRELDGSASGWTRRKKCALCPRKHRAAGPLCRRCVKRRPGAAPTRTPEPHP
jgi:hypothetical protein